MSLCKTACGAPMPVIVLMCSAVGVCVMLAQEMKCIVGHKKELSNVGAPGFLSPPHQGQSVYITTGHGVTAPVMSWQLWCWTVFSSWSIVDSNSLLVILDEYFSAVSFISPCSYACPSLLYFPLCLLGDCYHATQLSFDWLSCGAGMLGCFDS